MATALWGMDFVSDVLFNGRRFRLLTVVDHYTHECLAEAMTRLVAQRLAGGD
jgi:putative transposase